MLIYSPYKMADERRETTLGSFLPQVGPEIWTNQDIRFAFGEEKNQEQMRTENPVLFLWLPRLHLTPVGGYIIYWPLHQEAMKQNGRLLRVSQEIIDSYLQTLENSGEESIPPFSRLSKEQPYLANYLAWILDVFEKKFSPSQITQLHTSALVTYELLSLQAESDCLKSLNF